MSCGVVVSSISSHSIRRRGSYGAGSCWTKPLALFLTASAALLLGGPNTTTTILPVVSSFSVRKTSNTCMKMSASTSPPEHENQQVIALNVKFVAKTEDGKAQLLSLLQEDQTGVYDKEAGGLQFVIGQDVDDPMTIHLHEQYKNKAAFEEHTASRHFRDVMAFLESDPENALAGPPVVQTYRCAHGPRVIRRNPETDVPSKEIYCLNVESRIKPELRDDYLELMRSHRSHSLKEPRCVQFDYGVSLEDSDRVYIHEEYDGEGGFRAHAASRHFERFTEFNRDKQPYATPQAVRFFRLL